MIKRWLIYNLILASFMCFLFAADPNISCSQDVNIKTITSELSSLKKVSNIKDIKNTVSKSLKERSITINRILNKYSHDGFLLDVLIFSKSNSKKVLNGVTFEGMGKNAVNAMITEKNKPKPKEFKPVELPFDHNSSYMIWIKKDQKKIHHVYIDPKTRQKIYSKVLQKIEKNKNVYKLSIYRQYEDGSCTSGYLAVNGKIICYTLEKPWKDNSKNVSSIPKGSYIGYLRFRKKSNDFWRFQLLNVSNRDNIQIHIGNSTEDSKGCILVGNNIDKTLCKLGNSKKAYTKLKDSFYKIGLGKKIVVEVF